MHSKWLSFCLLFNISRNVDGFNMVLRGLMPHRSKGDSSSPWNIQDIIGIFAKRVPHVVSCVFHWFIDSPIKSYYLLIYSM